jgi:16S rRNA C967 or C1407 C5-methylase (RsmB/RsmF family)
VYAVCTVNADEAEAVVDASGLEADSTLSEEWPEFRHPRRPEFLQTLPHVHGTAGFFIARLRVA